VYCASGVRSEQAAKWLLKQGFAEVFNLKGGTSAWQIEGRQLEADVVTQQMTISIFQQKIQTEGIVLVDIGAEWCPPCKKMEPVLTQLQKEMGNKYQLVKVDGGTDIEVMKSIKASVLPTFIVYKEGKEIWRKEGIVDLTTLKSKLQ
jgi:thioredoxin-like negative regulator of GroEL